MKSTPDALLLAMNQETTTIVGCWLIEREDGTILGLTDNQSDLEIDSVIYHAASSYQRTAIGKSAGLSVDNMDLLGIMDSVYIDETGLRRGLYKNAQVWFFEVDYTGVTLGINKMNYGFIGELTVFDNTYIAEFRSLSQRLDQEIGEKAGRYCRVVLGSTKCGINLASWTETGTVTSATTRRNFADTSRTEANNYFKWGVVTFTSGLNEGVSMDVKRNLLAGGAIELRHSVPFTINIGDQYTISAGCNHLLKMPADVRGTAYTGDCRAKFNNVVNFRGEPEIPGEDRIISGT